MFLKVRSFVQPEYWFEMSQKHVGTRSEIRNNTAALETNRGIRRYRWCSRGFCESGRQTDVRSDRQLAQGPREKRHRKGPGLVQLRGPQRTGNPDIILNYPCTFGVRSSGLQVSKRERYQAAGRDRQAARPNIHGVKEKNFGLGQMAHYVASGVKTRIQRKRIDLESRQGASFFQKNNSAARHATIDQQGKRRYLTNYFPADRLLMPAGPEGSEGPAGPPNQRNVCFKIRKVHFQRTKVVLPKDFSSNLAK